ncbi:MAG: hypothetical protein HQL82_09860 [Magnetococcales bacterium]|nr:hypothetical protein [Magnetococcales bacterium]
MGKKGGASPPPSPDPMATAQAQADLNRDAVLTSARINRYDQVTPYGEVKWELDLNDSETRAWQKYQDDWDSYRKNLEEYESYVSGQRAASQLGSPSPIKENEWYEQGGRYYHWMPGPGVGSIYEADSVSAQEFDALKKGYGTRVGSAVIQKPVEPEKRDDLVPRYQQIVTLTPEGQRLQNTQTQLANTLGDLALERAGQIQRQPLTFDGLPAWRESIDRSRAPDITDPALLRVDIGAEDLDSLRHKVEESLYERSRRFLDPRFQREKAALETHLANQGIVGDSAAWSRAMGDFETTRNAAYQEAQDQAIQGGAAEQDRLLRNAMALSSQNYEQTMNARRQTLAEALQDAEMVNAARQQGIYERQVLRNAPIDELAAILQGSPATHAPTPMPTASYSVQAPDYQGEVYRSYQNLVAATPSGSPSNPLSSLMGAWSNSFVGTLGNLSGMQTYKNLV